MEKKINEISKDFLEKSTTPKSVSAGISIYKAKADDYKEYKLSTLINNTIKDMAIFGDSEIDLENIRDVKIKTMEYMQECGSMATYPTFEGLAHHLGYTQKFIMNKINQNKLPDNVIQWFNFCKEKFSAILTENALKNNSSSAYSIFYQKAAYGLKDSTEIIVTPNSDALGDIKSKDDILSELPE